MLSNRILARALLAATCLSLLAAGLLPPHDTWLLVVRDESHPVPTRLAVRTGMDFPVSETAVDPQNLNGVLLAPDGSRRALGEFRRDEASNSSECALPELAPGVHVATIDTQPKRLHLEARKFNDYLLHDGLPHILAARMDAQEEGNDASEQYRKCAKVVFRTGSGDGPFATVVGQRLEIVPLQDPTTLRVGATLRARVLFDGAPLVRANLCWDLPGNGEDLAGCTWTNRSGEAMVPIAQTGWMTLRLVHMTRPRAPEFEYESFWASCSFEVPTH